MSDQTYQSRFGEFAARARLLEPRVVARGVVHDEVGDHADAAPVRGVDEACGSPRRCRSRDGSSRSRRCRSRRRGAARGTSAAARRSRSPSHCEVVELLGQAAEVADAVVVAVGEAADVDLVEDGPLEPQRVGLEPLPRRLRAGGRGLGGLRAREDLGHRGLKPRASPSAASPGRQPDCRHGDRRWIARRRPVCARARARPRRHGDGLPGARHAARPAGGAEGARRRSRLGARGARALPARGAVRGAARAPERRPGLRRGRGRGRAVHRDGVRRGRDARGRARAARTAPARRGRAARARALLGARVSSRGRARAPRREAAERAPRPCAAR